MSPPTADTSTTGVSAYAWRQGLFSNEKKSSFAKFESRLCRFLSCTVTDTTPLCSSVACGSTVWGCAGGKLFCLSISMWSIIHFMSAGEKLGFSVNKNDIHYHNTLSFFILDFFSLYKQQCRGRIGNTIVWTSWNGSSIVPVAVLNVNELRIGWGFCLAGACVLSIWLFILACPFENVTEGP